MLFTGFVFLVIVINSILFSIPVAVFALFDHRGNLQLLLGRLWSRIILLITGVRVNVKGLENLKPDLPCIFAANHQSLYDIPVLMGNLPVQFRFIAKESLFKIPVFGWSMRLMKFISLDRGSREDALKRIREAIQRIKCGTSVLIFPEGTRSPDGKLLPFRKGAFLLANKTRSPIIPIVVKGTKDILPKGKLSLRSGSVELTICPPIFPDDYKESGKDALSERVHQELQKHLS